MSVINGSFEAAEGLVNTTPSQWIYPELIPEHLRVFRARYALSGPNSQAVSRQKFVIFGRQEDLAAPAASSSPVWLEYKTCIHL
jgi:hypothetical protein